MIEKLEQILAKYPKISGAVATAIGAGLSISKYIYETQTIVPQQYHDFINTLTYISFSTSVGVAAWFVGTRFKEKKILQKTNKLLVESEEKYRLLANNVQDNIWILGLDGKFKYVSPSVIKLSGFTVEETMKHSFEDIIAPKYLQTIIDLNAEELDKLHQGVRPRDKVDTIETEIMHKNGSYVPVEMKASFLFDANKNLTGILGITRDITDRKQKEEALKKSEEKYRLLATNTLDTIWTVDEKLNITFVNDAIVSLLGYTPNEFINMNAKKFTKPEGMIIKQKVVEELLDKYQKREISQKKFEVQQIRKNGDTIDVEITANLLLDSAGEFCGFQGRSIDITERKQAKKALIKEKEKAEFANNVLQTAYSDISHHLRTPLTALQFATEILRDKENIYDKDEKEFAIDSLNRSINKTTDAFDKLIANANLKSGFYKKNLEQHTVNITDKINAVAQEMIPKAKMKNLDMVLEYDNEKPIEVKIDEYGLEKSIYNLVENAIDYTDKGSVLLKLNNYYNEIEIMIKDTGVGMSEEKLKLVEDAYVRKDNTRYSSVGTTNLGLPIVNGIAKVNDWDFNLKSILNEGTTATIKIKK